MARRAAEGVSPYSGDGGGAKAWSKCGTNLLPHQSQRSRGIALSQLPPLGEAQTVDKLMRRCDDLHGEIVKRGW